MESKSDRADKSASLHVAQQYKLTASELRVG